MSWRSTKSKKVVAGMLIVLFVVPISFFIKPQKAEALGFVPIDIAWVTSLSTLANYTANVSVAEKELISDGIAYLVINAIITGLSTSVINWINNGFQGNPTFVTDFRGFLIDVADQELGTFIESGDLNFLCSPFSFPVQLQLLIDYYRPYRDRATCTLTEIAGNIERFVQGDFREMGWQGWFDLTTRQRNNPYGSLILAQAELNARIAWAQRIQQKILEFGRGFFSDCQTEGGKTVTDGTLCDIKTPGAVIENSLADALGLSADRLVLADEINEIIGALFAQLIQQTLVGGLSGLSSRDNVGRISYLDRLYQEGGATTDFNTIKNDLLSVIDNAIAQETPYKNSKQDILDQLDLAESTYESVIACYENKIAGGTLTSSEIATANSRIDSASTTVNSLLAPSQATTTEAIRVSDRNLELLNVFREDTLFAQTEAELDTVAFEFNDLEAEGVLHFRVDLEDQALLFDATLFANDASDKMSECNAFPPPATL